MWIEGEHDEDLIDKLLRDPDTRVQDAGNGITVIHAKIKEDGMSSHPGMPTDAQQDDAAEAFYGDGQKKQATEPCALDLTTDQVLDRCDELSEKLEKTVIGQFSLVGVIALATELGELLGDDTMPGFAKNELVPALRRLIEEQLTLHAMTRRVVNK